MQGLFIILSILQALVCFLLVTVVLLQRSQSGGSVGLGIGGGMGEALFGARVGNVLTRTTVVLAVVFLVNTTFLSILSNAMPRGGSLVDRVPARETPARETDASGPRPPELPDDL